MAPVTQSERTELVLHNGRITTLDGSRGEVQAVAIRDSRFVAIGSDREILAGASPGARVIDIGGRRVVPGLIDSHMHLIRGGLNYNLELRWDGVRSLGLAMQMLERQVRNTPPPQWVRVVGGFSAMQFVERRLPTIDELNAVAPETPVFILHLYDRALLNGAALRACGYTKDTPNPPGGEIERDARGNPTGLLVAKPNAYLLYATLAKGPKLAPEFQENSTLRFMRELNRLGVTGVIDAGGGFQNYPDDYVVVQKLAREGRLTTRIAYNLFTQNSGGEAADFRRWTSTTRLREGDDHFRLNGAGEMLVYSAADFEDFRQPRPEMPSSMEGQLEEVIRLLVEKRWPWRLHATYDETIGRALDVFERVHREVPIDGLRWFFDHAETVSDRNLERIARLGGGIAVQNRMAFQGEYFVERYGLDAARRAPPIRQMLRAGIPVAAGTDATRVASYNPWVSLWWLITGKTVGETPLRAPEDRIDRETALRLWTERSAWFSSDEQARGTIAVGRLADLAVLSADYFQIEPDAVRNLESLLTVVDGRIVHGGGEFSDLAPPLPPAMPGWSPVKEPGGLSMSSTHVRPPVEAFGCGCWAY